MRDKAWADTHWPSIEQIIREQVRRFAVVRPTGRYEDEHLGRDYRVDSFLVACRLRRMADCPWRDLTIRASRPSGVRTELSKLSSGYVRWYLYAWADDNEIQDWIFVDCTKVPWRNLPEQFRGRRKNKDGSSDFITLPIWWLWKIKALKDGVIGPKWLAVPGAA